MPEEVEIGSIKMSQQFYTVEYRLTSKPFTGQISIHPDEFSEDRVKELIKADIEDKKDALALLDKIVKEWNGKKIKIDIP